MKNKIFGLTMISVFVCSMAMSCGSTKKASSIDSATTSDSNKMKAPMDTPSSNGVDTTRTKPDTVKKDTIKKP